VFRTEQAAVNLVSSGYVGWTNYLLTALSNPSLSSEQLAKLNQMSNDVKRARLSFANTVLLIDGLRESYETNKTLKPELEAGLAAINAQSSNIIWLISQTNFWRNP
jgi:hypothetical protein